MKNIDMLTDKLQGIPKTPATQNMTKNRMDFPMHEQSISNSKTEAITWGMIQNISEKYLSIQTQIYRPPQDQQKIHDHWEQKVGRH